MVSIINLINAFLSKYLLVVLIFLSLNASAQLWTENFTGEANGATSGVAAGTPGGTWSVTTATSGTFSRQNTFWEGPCLQIDDTGTEGVWESDNFSISATGMATISVDLSTTGTSSSDYIRAYYKVDGGSEILFAELMGSILDGEVTGSAIVSGSNLQIVIRGIENTTGTFFGVPFSFYADNITVTAVPVVYSRASTAWNLGTTWSTTGFAGASCGCTPTTGQVAIIGGGLTVDLTADASVGGVNIRTTGTLRYTAANVDLGIEAGLLRVESGGTLNSNAQAGAQIDFNENVGGATLQVDVGGTVTIEDITLTANATNLHYFIGGGTFTITDDILIGADGATLTNNMSSTVAVGDRIEFSAGTTNSGFVNNGTITATTLFFGDDTNFFTNSSTATFSGNITANGNTVDNNTVTNNSLATLNFVNLDGNAAGGGGDGGDLTVLNSGTINQSGTFVDIPNNTNALNDINNLSGATWNYSGTGHDTNVRLFANNPTNLFNYGLSGAQQIITPVNGNGYNDLTLQSVSAAAKTALGNFSVSGNYTRSGAATFSNGGFTVTLNGTSTQTLSAVGGETFSGLTINNTFATSPQIILNDMVSVSSTLTMTDGVVQSSAANLLIMLNASAATIGSASSYVDGPIQYNMAVNATTRTLNFPIGRSGNYGAVSLRVRHSAATSYSYTAEVVASSATALGYTLATGTDRVSGLRYWDIRRGLTASPLTTNNTNLVTTGAANAPRLTINYVAADEVNQPANLTVVKNISGGTAWFNIGATAAGSPTGSITTTAPSANFTSFSMFALANLTGGTNPLPIELLSFDAKVDNHRVILTWATASELNNDFFTLERARNIEVFEPFGNPIEGKGTTSEKSDYTAFDENPIYGRSYYRLKQTDFDGAYTYSPVKTIDYEGPEFSILKVYPNPGSGQQITIHLNGLKDQPTVPVQIFNVHGQKVFDRVLDVTIPGTLTQVLEFATPLKQGLYIVKAGPTLQLTQKIVVE